MDGSHDNSSPQKQTPLRFNDTKEGMFAIRRADATLRFRYRIVVYSGKVSKKRLDEDYWAYIN